MEKYKVFWIPALIALLFLSVLFEKGNKTEKKVSGQEKVLTIRNISANNTFSSYYLSNKTK